MRGKPVTFTGLTGGVNYIDSPYSLGTGEARDLLNVVATGRGSLRKRDGSALLVDTAGSNISTLSKVTTSVQPLLVMVNDTAVSTVDAAGAVTGRGGTVTAGVPWSVVQAPKGPMFMSNRTDPPLKWTGTGNVAAWTGTSVPNARHLVYKETRLWAANMATYTAQGAGAPLDDAKSAVVFSSLGDPTVYPGENVVLFDPNDGEEITAIADLGPYLLVSKMSKMWIVYDLETGANRPTGTGTGVASARSMALSPEGLWFLANDNSVMVTNGSSFKTVSNRVKPLLDKINPASRQTATGAYFDGHYYLTISTPVGDRTLDYDTNLDAWFVHSYAPADWCVWAPSFEPVLYAARGDAIERAFEPGTTTDADAVFPSYWQGPYLTFGAPYLNKRVRRIHFDGTGRVVVGVATNFSDFVATMADTDFQPPDSGVWGSGEELWGSGSGTWGGQVAVGEAEILTPGVARAWSVQFGNQSTDPWEIHSYTMAMQTRRDGDAQRA